MTKARRSESLGAVLWHFPVLNAEVQLLLKGEKYRSKQGWGPNKKSERGEYAWGDHCINDLVFHSFKRKMRFMEGHKTVKTLKEMMQEGWYSRKKTCEN